MTSTSYKKLQDQFIEETRLKDGDTVKVLGKAQSRQLGWANSWAKSMDDTIGNKFKVDIKRSGDIGIYLDGTDGMRYPFYVLEKVAKPMPAPIPLGDSYEVTFREGGTIAVGCQVISLEKLAKIYETAKTTV